MKYRSSVVAFAKAVMCDAAQYRGDEIRQVMRGIDMDSASFKSVLEQALSAHDAAFVKAAKSIIPEGDWQEIIDYVCKYRDTYGFASPVPGMNKNALLLFPWVAAVAICALDDIGR